MHLKPQRANSNQAMPSTAYVTCMSELAICCVVNNKTCCWTCHAIKHPISKVHTRKACKLRYIARLPQHTAQDTPKYAGMLLLCITLQQDQETKAT